MAAIISNTRSSTRDKTPPSRDGQLRAMPRAMTLHSMPLRSMRLRSVTAAAALLLSQGAHAAQWTFASAVAASETYTDNVSLKPDATAKSDFITSVAPSLSISALGPNIKLHSFFQLQSLNYANQNAGSTLQKQVATDANIKLLDNWLYLDALGSITQQNISAFGPQPTSNLNGGVNQTTVRSTHVSPYVSHHFDRFATTELRYARDSVAADSGGLASTKTDTLSARITSDDAAFRLLNWGANYSDQIIHYPTSGDVTLRATTANAGYLIAPRFRLTASTGYESNDYAALGTVSKGASWSTGFDWIVSRRTHLAATTGRHYYGASRSLSASTRSRVANWQLSYDESVTTTPSQVTLPGSISTAAFLDQLFTANYPDPTVRAQQVAQFIQQSGLPSTLASPVNFFTNATFLQKQLQASVILTGPRTTLLMTLFDTQRMPLSQQQNNGVPLGSDETHQLGVSAVLSRKLSPRTGANISVLAQRATDVTIGRVDTNQSVRFGMTRQLGRKINGNIELRRNQGQSSQPGVSYRENAIAVFLNYQL